MGLLRTTLFAATVVAFACLVGIWVKSYLSTDIVNFSHVFSNSRIAKQQDVFVISGRGSITIGWFRNRSRTLWPGWKSGFRHTSADPDDAVDFDAWPPGCVDRSFGFVRAYSLHDGFNNDDSINFPLWLPAVAMVLASAAGVVDLISIRHQKLGLCVACGYDLRASRDRCPECGLAIESAQKLEKNTDAIPT
jgi:predicted RNA-binding Zn-ribbon protein involved in translation (DUF1610 family)